MNEPGIRVDKWLWFARFFKTRSLAAKLCNAGRLRVDGVLVSKAHQTVRPGNVLTFPQGRAIRVVKILSLANRRGPSSEAQGLYEDLKPLHAGTSKPPTPEPQKAGRGRPTKKDRRRLDRMRQEVGLGS